MLPDEIVIEETDPTEGIAAGDLFQYLDLVGKLITAYLQYRTLPPGGEVDAPPIHYRRDTLTLHIKRDGG